MCIQQIKNGNEEGRMGLPDGSLWCGAVKTSWGSPYTNPSLLLNILNKELWEQEQHKRAEPIPVLQIWISCYFQSWRPAHNGEGLTCNGPCIFVVFVSCSRSVAKRETCDEDHIYDFRTICPPCAGTQEGFRGRSPPIVSLRPPQTSPNRSQAKWCVCVCPTMEVDSSSSLL